LVNAESVEKGFMVFFKKLIQKKKFLTKFEKEMVSLRYKMPACKWELLYPEF